MRKYVKWVGITGLDLKKHQIDGVRWCLERESVNVGGIIADEMGLGKTYMMMGLIVADRKCHNLIVVPPALLSQWKSCLEKYIGAKHLYIYHREFNDIKNAGERQLGSLIVLTSYYMLKKLNKAFVVKWDRVIYDEAHHLRNNKTSKCLGALNIKSKLNWCVTGTPVQNRMSDIYTLCNLIGCSRDLEEVMLRRRAVDAGIVLPLAREENIIVKWSSKKERNFAELIHRCSAEIIDDGALEYNFAQICDRWFILVAMLRSKQVCIYPDMVKAALSGMEDEGMINHDEVNRYMLDISSSKFNIIINNLVERRENSKLVFCNFHAEIDELERRLVEKGLRVGVIDGRVCKSKRDGILKSGIDQILFDDIFGPLLGVDTGFLYEEVSSYLTYDVVLLQIQTCCEGLNLQNFNEVHFTSPHYNPAVEDQAICRCKRIGQRREVLVYRYIMEDLGGGLSFDKYCLNIQERKREIYV